MAVFEKITKQSLSKPGDPPYSLGGMRAERRFADFHEHAGRSHPVRTRTKPHIPFRDHFQTNP